MLLCVYSCVDLFENYECVHLSVHTCMLLCVCVCVCVYIYMCVGVGCVLGSTECVFSALPVPVCSGVSVEQAGTL